MLICNMGMIISITGPMYSGKTSRLLEEYEKFSGKKLVIKSSIDNRYSKDHVCNHDGTCYKAIPVEDSSELLTILSEEPDTKGIFIDEAQFLGEGILSIIKFLSKFCDIYLTILDLDYNKEYFKIGSITSKDIIKSSQYIVYLEGKCALCNEPSKFTKRLIKNDNLIAIGNFYSPRCEKCFDK